ncbi:bifunctional 5,10-methylenetetrahydrofolate dehydrogenase/5,10-methenyltetrahydrofolate cyclohydrolase [Brevibacterium metallidurans]|uniref:Bifunctional protein FolD n=1 Tax=Brevibacterium metallidurans TaxID=1482676 RepID=A0ABN0SR82_9MICO
MAARIIDGKAIAKRYRAETARLVEEFAAEAGRRPALATVLVGDDPASQVYIGSKRKAATSVGIGDRHRELPAEASIEDIAGVLTELAADDEVSGILLQLPLPGGQDASALIDLIPSVKDVDGLTTQSTGLLARGEPGLRPCTPRGIITLLDETGIDLDGARAVVIGRSELVGRPMAQLLVNRNATVTIAHSHTADLPAVAREAEVLVVAMGRQEAVDDAFVAPGATVIDVGIHRTSEGLRGDVAFAEVAPIAGAITPVPGGVGPMTIETLLRNTLDAARLQAGLPLSDA